LAKQKNQSQRQISDEGRKILYRLLLLAVSIVYALVFILDYLLQLQFTFFLLLSLFGFVILTLLYMWFKVSNVEVVDQPLEEEESPKEPVLPFDDATFFVNMSTGLSIDCNEAAVNLFEADDSSNLIGIDLNSLMALAWRQEESAAIRTQLQKTKKARASGQYLTLKGKVFTGLMQANRIDKETESVLVVRITDITSLFERDLRTPEIISEKEESDPYAYLFQDGLMPVASIGINYKFSRVNKSFCDLLGYTEHELMQLTALDIFLPDDKEAEKRSLSLIFRGEVPLSRKEKRFVRRNGDVIWVNTSSNLLRDKKGSPQFIMTMAENITQRKRVERSLFDKKDKLASLIENAEYSILSIDRHNTILLINSRLCDLLFALTGIVVEPGFNIMDILPEAFHAEYKKLHERAFKGEHFLWEKKLSISGKAVDVELVLTPVQDETGKVRSVSIFGHNISERKKWQEELLQEKALAESATQAKSSFLATMSHEIRTPLNGVIGMGRLLSDTTLTAKQKDYVESMLLSGEALLSVINDILDYSKIESEKMELEDKAFALRRCIEETFDLLAAKAIEKKLSLQYSIARNVPSYIRGDIVRLRQILMNLVGNAIKFTPEGKISIAVTLNSQTGDELELHFSIKDTGIGIPQDRISRLFQSYSQADKGTARTYGGTGLGLVICRNLVHLMGGKIWVESEQGKGSNFQFTIQTRKALAKDISEKAVAGTNRLVNSHVLLIADDKTEADMYFSFFKRWNMVPHIEYGVLNSLDIIRSKSDYNLVLIDAQMTSMPPMELAERIRQLRSQDDLPIVFFNADAADAIQYDYTSDIVSAMIPKNVDRSKVLDILIGVFSVEDHQRTQHEAGLKTMGSKLAAEYPIQIMIAEDNLINQKLVQNIFEGLGYKPTIVSNGLQVLEAMKQKKFDLIFMDVQMPELDGLETTRRIIKEFDPSVRPVIVAMTAFALEGDKAKCIDAGMSDYISKPFMVEEIVERIKKWGVQEQVKVKNTMSTQTKEAAQIEKQVLVDETVLNRLKDMAASADMDFFGEVIRMFIQQGKEIISDIEDLCKKKEWDKMSQQAHKLKGSSLNIGANMLAETCRIIELKGKAPYAEDCSTLANRLRSDFDKTIKKITDITGIKEN
jgi:PAS domain S-box-containing protein